MSVDLLSIKVEKTCNDAAAFLVKTYPDLKEMPTRSNMHYSAANMFDQDNHYHFGCFWQKLKDGKNYLWFNPYGVENQCPGYSPCTSICTKNGALKLSFIFLKTTYQRVKWHL